MIKIGQNFGNFFIKSEIGKGGMGTIYFAVDTMLSREVALKLIHPQLTNNSQLMERFKIEAMTQARMNHPNIVMIFTFNKIEDEYIIAMEYVDGKSLKEVLTEKKVLPIKEAVHYLKQMLKGLHYAHSRNIIHRDIKPANIMINKENEVKLSDFGIAKVFGTQGVTKTGMLLGTPWYTSPEQILGKSIDFRSDLYSAGITFYEMLTGRVPFDSETNSDFQIQRAHLETPPTRPSIYNSEIGIKVEKFILKALQKNPDKRFQSASEMLEELEKVEATVMDATLAEKSAVKPRLDKPGIHTKKRFLSPLKVLFFIVLVAVVVMGIFFLSKGEGEKKEPIGDTENVLTVNEKKDTENLTKKTEEKPPVPDEGDLKDKGEVEIIQPKAKEAESKITDTIQKKTTQTEEVKVSGKKKTQILPKETKNSDTKEKEKEKKLDLKPVEPEKEKPEQIEQPVINVEAELFKIRKLIQERSLKKAETIGEELLTKTDSPKVNAIVGSIKFFMSKYSETDQYWKRAIDNGGEIKLKFYHKHGIFNKGCSGHIILKKNMVIYESSTKPEHSLAVTKNNVRAVRKPKRLFGIFFQYIQKGKTRSDTFILFFKRNRRKNEKFIADFINKYIMEGR